MSPLRPFIIIIALLIAGAFSAFADGERTGAPAEEQKPSPEEIASETKKRMANRSLYFRGERIFDRQCVQCHGTTGRGNGPWAEPMKTKPRNLRSGVFKFRTTPYGKLPADTDLRRTIRSGISGTAMPAFTKLSDADLDGIVAFVQNFSRRWKDAGLYAEPIALPELPGWSRDKEERAAHAATGKTLFAKLCASCHGPEGKGDGLAAKGLLDVWENPIMPADLTSKHHKSGDRRQDIYRTIATGLDGTPMIGYHGTLKPEQIWDLVEFIKSIESDGAEKK